MADLQALKTELDTDPLGRGYSGMDDATAASDLNTIYRDAPASSDLVYNYLVTNKNRTNVGSNPGDTISTFCFGRIEMIATADIGSNPLDATPAFNVTKKMQHSCRTVCSMVGDNGGFGSNSFDWASVPGQELLQDLVDAGAIGAADRTAIIALSSGTQSRANELNLGRVFPLNVTQARAL